MSACSASSALTVPFNAVRRLCLLMNVIGSTQLVDYKNSSMLKPEAHDFNHILDSRSFDVSPLFASGAVYTSSILDMVLSQVGPSCVSMCLGLA